VVPAPLSSPTFTSEAIVDSRLRKSQKWLIESFREVVKGDVTHMTILKDLEESFRKDSKEDHEGLSSEEDRDLATTKEELERVLGGRGLGSALGPAKVIDALVSIPLSSTLSFGQVFLLENQDANSAGALALGERLRLSLGSGAPIHKQIVRYYRRAEKE
jgi:hypothetical protein